MIAKKTNDTIKTLGVRCKGCIEYKNLAFSKTLMQATMVIVIRAQFLPFEIEKIK